MSDVPHYGDPGQPGHRGNGSGRSGNGGYVLEALRAEARLEIVRCGCCGGATKLYRRKLNSGMAAAACWLWANHGTDFAHLAKEASWLVIRNRDYAKLEVWNLIEQKPNDDRTKRTSGIWKLTDRGRDFALRRIQVASHAFLRSPGNILEGWEDTSTDVVASLGRHFNYTELMRGEG